ncbi:MAG: FCD domain-containing protein [Schaedlerella sp.]|uniref:FadR/GntR family transcriptional regulator n=1 Tax=Schaedlerella sp. TaxID=2676057 RepID=UPI00265F868B|nr:FCD domain-containing protein [uncultured Schaedlerella sp.]
MPFQKIVMPTMKELFVRQMESMILSGELAAGEQLPNERDLAAQMNISRTVVNSGIQELAKNGFVCIVPRKGTFVNDFLRQGNLGTLTSIFHHSGGQFDMSMLTALMEYRSINEQKCARLAAERHTAEDLKRMFELLEQMEACRDPEECAEISTRFHHAIFLATQNLIYPLMYNSFEEMSMAVTRILFRHLPLPQVCTAMRNVAEAIAARDTDQAEKLMAEHTVRCSQILMEQYPFGPVGAEPLKQTEQ